MTSQGKKKAVVFSIPEISRMDVVTEKKHIPILQVGSKEVRPFRHTDHGDNYFLDFTDDASGETIKCIYKTCKDGDPHYTQLEAAFSAVWHKALPDLTPGISRLAYQSDSAMQNYHSKTVEVDTSKITGICIQAIPGFKTFADIRDKPLDELLKGQQHKALRIKLVTTLLAQIRNRRKGFYERPKGGLEQHAYIKEWSDLNLVEKIKLLKTHVTNDDNVDEVHQQLAKILVSAYVLEEDDLHMDNIGISLTDNDVKVVKIDHDMSFFKRIAAQAAKNPRPYDFLTRGDRFAITANDLNDFPNIKDAKIYYWPTKDRHLRIGKLKKKFGGSPIYDEDKGDIKAFSELSKVDAFNTAVQAQVKTLVALDLKELRSEMYQSIGDRPAMVNSIMRALRERQHDLAGYLASKNDLDNADILSDFETAKTDLNQYSGSIDGLFSHIDADYRLSLVQAKEQTRDKLAVEIKKINSPVKFIQFHNKLESGEADYIRQLRSRLSLIRKKRGLYGSSGTYKKIAKMMAAQGKVLLANPKLAPEYATAIKQIMTLHTDNARRWKWSFERQPVMVPQLQAQKTLQSEGDERLEKAPIPTLSSKNIAGQLASFSPEQKALKNLSDKATSAQIDELDVALQRGNVSADVSLDKAKSLLYKAGSNEALAKRVKTTRSKIITQTGSVAVEYKYNKGEFKFKRRSNSRLTSRMKTRFLMRKDEDIGLTAISKVKKFKLEDKHYALTKFAAAVVFDKCLVGEPFDQFSIADGHSFELLGANQALLDWFTPVLQHTLNAYQTITGTIKEIKLQTHSSELSFKSSDTTVSLSANQKKLADNVFKQWLKPVKLQRLDTVTPDETNSADGELVIRSRQFKQ